MANTVESFSYLNESCHIGQSLDWKEGDSTWSQLRHEPAEMQQHAQSHWCPSCEMSKELLTLSLVLGPAKPASPGSWLETHAEPWASQPGPAGSVSDFNKTCQTWIHAEGGEAQVWTVSVGARPLPMRPSALVLRHSLNTGIIWGPFTVLMPKPVRCESSTVQAKQRRCGNLSQWFLSAALVDSLGLNSPPGLGHPCSSFSPVIFCACLFSPGEEQQNSIALVLTALSGTTGYRETTMAALGFWHSL